MYPIFMSYKQMCFNLMMACWKVEKCCTHKMHLCLVVSAVILRNC